MLEKWKENIFLAIISQDLEKLKRVTQESDKRNLNFSDEDGNTPLHFSSDRQNEKTLPIVQFILENGGNPLAVNIRFETPLDKAKQNNNVPAMSVMNYFISKQNIELENQ